jgi:hypothetical protein
MRCLHGRRADFDIGTSSEPQVRHDILRSVGRLGVGSSKPENIEESRRFEGEVAVDLAVETSVGASMVVALRLRAGRGGSRIVCRRGVGVTVITLQVVSHYHCPVDSISSPLLVGARVATPQGFSILPPGRVSTFSCLAHG